jgi:hypothetical protein
MNHEQLFSPPRDVTDVSHCYFYHVMDLPGYGTVGSEWDLRGGEEAYLGGVSFQGKRVLELGTASGYLCRYMESNGADVIGFDLSSELSWDLVPIAGLDITSFAARMKEHIETLKNGWWFAHRLLGSKARVVYGNIYDVPAAIGPVDIATFGSILLHLRDPFKALHSALRITREYAIVTELHPEQRSDSGPGTLAPQAPSEVSSCVVPSGCMCFLPDPKTTDPGTAATWWCFSPGVICRFLAVLGFGDQVVTEHFQTYRGNRFRLYTVVAKRTLEEG